MINSLVYVGKYTIQGCHGIPVLYFKGFWTGSGMLSSLGMGISTITQTVHVWYVYLPTFRENISYMDVLGWGSLEIPLIHGLVW